MATRYINQGFEESVRNEASRLIEAGKVFFGGIWKNRTATARQCGYRGGWEEVPTQVKLCVNQIGRAASIKGKKKAAETKLNESQKFYFSPFTKDVLEEIWDGNISVPRDTAPEQIRVIREYITIRAGFTPKKILLGIESRMKK